MDQDQDQDRQRQAQAALAQWTGGLSPAMFSAAWADYWMNLLASPARQAALWQQATDLAIDTLSFAQAAASGVATATAADPRYADPAWQQFPFNVFARAHQNLTALTQVATQEIAGLDSYQRSIVDFSLRLTGDLTAPANHLLTNPQLMAQTRAEQGENLARGHRHLLDDLRRVTQGLPAAGTEAFVVGQQVAATPGKVVCRNALMELLQYSPTTPQVHQAPLLIVPAWIMKYYILDLSAQNSLIRWLVSEGHTVFCVSWKNPDADDRDRGMEDYLQLGLEAALQAVTSIVPNTPVQAVGYCIGGTLLAIGAAALAAKGDQRLGSLTLLAAQTDFSEPGELSLFINPAQLAMLDAQMHQQGVLNSSQMSGAFQLLRPQELILQPMVNTYLKGQREALVDLMAWNADGTRMPGRMHSEYLQRLDLHNELAQDRFTVDGKPVRLAQICVPAFVVGTETDHVAPWKSVYKASRLLGSQHFTFLLTSGGHNAGIVTGPVHPRRRHRVRERASLDAHLTPAQWRQTTEPQAGSWWPTWGAWLRTHGGPLGAPPAMGAASCPPLGAAPGQYVLQR